MVDGSEHGADVTPRGADDITTARARLALFAKSPSPGAVKTRLVPPLTAAQAADIARAFATDVARTIGSIDGLDPWLFVPRGERDTAGTLAPGWRIAEQAEGDLGARLAAALAQLGAGGLPAIVVGADHPDLPRDRIEEAIDALARADVCFGPTHDGGFYLTAARAPSGRLAPLFANIEWSSPRTLAMILERARELNLRTARLEAWFDVDTPDDLRALRERLESRPEAAPATRDALARIGPLPGGR